jgi:hypothetical protein
MVAQKARSFAGGQRGLCGTKDEGIGTGAERGGLGGSVSPLHQRVYFCSHRLTALFKSLRYWPEISPVSCFSLEILNGGTREPEGKARSLHSACAAAARPHYTFGRPRQEPSAVDPCASATNLGRHRSFQRHERQRRLDFYTACAARRDGKNLSCIFECATYHNVVGLASARHPWDRAIQNNPVMDERCPKGRARVLMRSG